MMVNFFPKNRGGELSTQQIILLIILITSFVVILFFLFRLNLGQESEKELCHNSVVMKGSAIIPGDALPLKCSTGYVCITKKSGCEGLLNPIVKKVNTKDELYEVLAEEMRECWWMFGEGKVNYVGKDFFTKDNYCSVCSQILFDESLSEIEGVEDKISKDELYEYMSENEFGRDEKNYLEYLFGTKNLQSLKEGILQNENNIEGIGTFGTVNVGEQYWLITGITSEVEGRGWKIAASVGVIAVGFFVPPVWATWAGTIAGVMIIGAGEYGAGIEPEIGAITVKGNGVKNEFMAPTIQEINSEKLNALNCEEIITLS